MKEEDFKYLNYDEIDLLDLCNKAPELANEIVKSANLFQMIYSKTFKSIPYILFDKKPFSITNINKIVSIRGTAIKINQVYLKNIKTKYTCLKCNTKGVLDRCIGRQQTSNTCESCGSNSILKSEHTTEAMKSQSIRLQDIENLCSLTETYEILLEGDLAGKVVPGEEVICTGVVSIKWKKFKIGEPMTSSLYLHALSIEKNNDVKNGATVIDDQSEFLSDMSCFEKRKFLINTFADEIFGYSNVKLGHLLVLCSNHFNNKTSNTRSSSHILVVGGSGTGKSHFLRSCLNLVSPSILTNGIGTSNAGLTTCAVRQGKDWSLEAGALVLADGGICCIDEFNKLRTTEKGGLLEAMEQQTLSIAKAGIVSSINTRCSIIAACNITHFYDKNKTVSENTHISTPLISRFDLIFGMFDTRCRNFDVEVSNLILNRTSELPDIVKGESEKWLHNDLKGYISFVKKLDVDIPQDIYTVLHKYYNFRRSRDGPNEFNTIRMLESMVRLTEAHTRLMNKNVAELEDAYAVILLFETSISSTSTVSLQANSLFTDKNAYDDGICYVKKKFQV